MQPLRTFFAASFAGIAVYAAAQVGGQQWLPQNQVRWSTLQTGIVSKITQPSFQTLSSENDLQNYWRAATGQAPQTAPRNIDWLKEKVVVVHLGQRSSGGYSVVVTGIDRNGATATVHASERTPLKGQWVSEMITSPWVMVRVQRDLPQIQLDLKKTEGTQVGGVTIYQPGGAVIRPGNYDRIGGARLDPRNAVTWSSLRNGTQSYITDAGVVTLATEGDWQRYWSRLTHGEAGPAPRNVDWTKEKLVAIHLGQRPTNGYALEILSVERNGQYGIVRAVEEMPVAGSWITRRPTSPFAVVRVPRDLGNVSLDLTYREGDGGRRIVDGQ